jgi:hypothetical protein
VNWVDKGEIEGRKRHPAPSGRDSETTTRKRLSWARARRSTVSTTREKPYVRITCTPPVVDEQTNKQTNDTTHGWAVRERERTHEAVADEGIGAAADLAAR